MSDRSPQATAKPTGKVNDVALGTKVMSPTPENICHGRYLLNDSGNADRLFDEHGDSMLWVEDRGVVMMFDGRRWVLDWLLAETWMEENLRAAYADAGKIERSEDRKAFLCFINHSLERSGITNALHSAKRKLQRAKMRDFDANPYLLNFQNGTVNLKTGKLRQHDKRDRMTKMIPFDYDPNARAPKWLEFLYRIQGDDRSSSSADREDVERRIEYLQRAVGCSATGISTKLLFVCYGPKDGGKTTFQETVREVLGPGQYAGLLQIDTLLMRSGSDLTAQADVAGLQGLRFVSTSEVEKGRRLAIARVKYLTGGGEIKACRKHENPFSFQPTHTIWIDTNEKPLISDPHDAVWGRIRTIPFSWPIPKEEQQARFKDALLREKPGIAAWAVEGARKYLRDGLCDPPEVIAATESYRAESDGLREFLSGEYEIDPERQDYWVGTDELWNAYKAWIEKTAGRLLVKGEFENQIEKSGCQRKRNPAGTVRAWRGIRRANPPS